MGARRLSPAAEEEAAFSTSVFSPGSSLKSRSVAVVLMCTSWELSVRYKWRSVATGVYVCVCVAALHWECVSAHRQPATRAAIQALHWAHLRSAPHVARLSGDLARPIFIPPPPPPYAAHRALIDTDKRVKKRFSVSRCRNGCRSY